MLTLRLDISILLIPYPTHIHMNNKIIKSNEGTFF